MQGNVIDNSFMIALVQNVEMTPSQNASAPFDYRMNIGKIGYVTLPIYLSIEGDTKAEANARPQNVPAHLIAHRMIATWNACRGFSTDALKNLADPPEGSKKAGLLEVLMTSQYLYTSHKELLELLRQARNELADPFFDGKIDDLRATILIKLDEFKYE